MSGWTAKRFWKEVFVGEAEDGAGHLITLDGRPVRTPAKTPLVTPTRALAEAVAEEWLRVDEVIDPTAMPYTRAVNAALDKAIPQQPEVAGLIADYGASDLLCYRAASPDALIARQAELWDPILDWAKHHLNAPLKVGTGVMPVEQHPHAVAALSGRVNEFDAFGLTALHDLVSLSGSLVLGLAVTEGHLQASRAWTISRVDEEWQAEQWGKDEDAESAAAIKREAFLQAERFYRLLS